MGTRYDQLDIDERYERYRLHEAGKGVREMGGSVSTISRELHRNALLRGGYKPGSAGRMALSRCRRLSRIERLSPLRTYVGDRLAMGWSPEQIAGRLRLEGSKHTVGVETIYRFIYRPAPRQGQSGPVRLQALLRADRSATLHPRTPAIRGVAR